MSSSRNSGYSFVRQLTQNQNQIYSFILTMVPNWSDAEDILQDTTEILWRKYGQNVQIDNFSALGMQISKNLVYAYYRKKKRQERFLEEDALEDIAIYAKQLNADTENRVRLLHKCLSKLPNRDSELIRLRYEEGLKVKKIAEVVRRPVGGLYKALGRIHDVIMRCIKRSLAIENSR